MFFKKLNAYSRKWNEWFVDCVAEEELVAKTGVFFSMLIAQGCIISNRKSLLVYAAWIHTAFHTYTRLGPSGQDGFLMDHIPEINW